MFWQKYTANGILFGSIYVLFRSHKLLHIYIYIFFFKYTYVCTSKLNTTMKSLYFQPSLLWRVSSKSSGLVVKAARPKQREENFFLSSNLASLVLIWLKKFKFQHSTCKINRLLAYVAFSEMPCTTNKCENYHWVKIIKPSWITLNNSCVCFLVANISTILSCQRSPCTHNRLRHQYSF